MDKRKSTPLFSLHPLTAEEALRAALRAKPADIKALEAKEKGNGKRLPGLKLKRTKAKKKSRTRKGK